MKKLLALALITFGALTTPAYAEPQPYKFDPNHTELLFTYRHLGLSNAYGQFKKVDGTVTIDREKPAESSVDVTIDVASIDSGIDKFDEHLKADDFFDVKNFPTMTFKSTKVEKLSDEKFKVTGDLTIKGKTVPTTLDVTLLADQKHPIKQDIQVAAFSASTTIKRSEFGMGKYVPLTSDEVKIIIETEMFGQ